MCHVNFCKDIVMRYFICKIKILSIMPRFRMLSISNRSFLLYDCESANSTLTLRQGFAVFKTDENFYLLHKNIICKQASNDILLCSCIQLTLSAEVF